MRLLAYKVVLAKSVKVNGKYYKPGESVENVSESLFQELEEKNLIVSSEKQQTRNSKTKSTDKVGE